MLNISHHFLLEQTIKNHLQMIKNHIHCFKIYNINDQFLDHLFYHFLLEKNI
jgi:hypothetical protein